MENKAMTMDQLDQVAGGYHAETAVLAEAFGYGDELDRYSTPSGKTCDKVRARLYTEFGITAVLKDTKGIFDVVMEKNEYVDNKTGKHLTHLEVMTHVRQKYPHGVSIGRSR